MTQAITLPLWLFTVLLALALLAALAWLRLPGLRMLTLRRLVRQEEGRFRAKPAELPALRYDANAIDHLCRPLDRSAVVLGAR